MPSTPDPDLLPDYSENPGPLLLLTLATVGVFSFLQVYSVQSILPELQRDLNASVVEIGSAVGATVLAMALIAPLMGMISDAVGRKWLIVSSVFVLALPTAAMMWVENVHGLVVMRFLQGLAVPGITVVTIAYIGEEFRGSAIVRMMTVYITGSVLGGFLGRFLLGHLTDIMTWRQAFMVMAVLNLCGVVLIWRVLPRSRHFVANAQIGSALHALGQVVRHPALYAASALGFTALFVQVGMFTFVNFHLAAAPYHFSTAALANVFAVYLLGVVVTPLVGAMIPRLGLGRTILLSVLTSGVGLSLTLLPSAPGIIAALAVASCGMFITNSATLSFIAYEIDEGRSLASGLYYSAFYVGGFAGAWVCGLAYDRGGWTTTVLLLLAVQVSGWMVAWRFIAPSSSARS